ncbi:MAG: hypothetical protein SCAL_000783 [Candidatus Syntrophoarchaeum caldarius]|uniref:Uncharacterized protein n=1 Tax=Candidatus Syntropharchaeum caldarium TaxID=1838285 RepID=A0A1F2PA81_9EURY|nr:MAG: hypothetical protein SCAL_000783 [Candidatus Syntrophoarchaeum caldarius]
MIEVAKKIVLKMKTIVEKEVTKSDKSEIEILFKP